MLFIDTISRIKLFFVKDKELYVFIHRVTGRYPRNINLYKVAMAHRSHPVMSTDGHYKNNERLEFLGDAVLNSVVADFLYKTYPNKREGFLTSMRSRIVQRDSLNRIGTSLHLDSHVHVSTHGSSHNNYIWGNSLEALVGAFYLDHGYQRCRKFIINRLIKKHFDMKALVRNDQNYKSRLLEWAQKNRINVEYRLVDSYTDSDKNPVFRTAVLLGGIHAGEATGYSKKASHQTASRIVLERLADDPSFCEQVMETAVQL